MVYQIKLLLSITLTLSLNINNFPRTLTCTYNSTRKSYNETTTRSILSLLLQILQLKFLLIIRSYFSILLMELLPRLCRITINMEILFLYLCYCCFLCFCTYFKTLKIKNFTHFQKYININSYYQIICDVFSLSL